MRIHRADYVWGWGTTYCGRYYTDEPKLTIKWKEVTCKFCLRWKADFKKENKQEKSNS